MFHYILDIKHNVATKSEKIVFIYFSGIHFLGQKYWIKCLECLFKQEHIVILIWYGEQVCEKPL